MTAANDVSWDRLLADDPQAWQRLLERLLPEALRQFCEGFQLKAVEDLSNPGGALVSAWPSFRRHILTERTVHDAENLESLAAYFVRITYNRSQRRWRQAQKMSHATGSGTSSDSANPRNFDPVDPDTKPDEVVEQQEFLQNFRQLVDEVVGGLQSDPLKYGIVREWLQAELQVTQSDLANHMGTTQSKVSRVLGQFQEEVRRQVIDQGLIETGWTP